MTDNELHLLTSLAWMCEQYLGTGKADFLDHDCISAGEDAVEILASYGLVEPSGRGGTWTAQGKALLDTPQT